MTDKAIRRYLTYFRKGGDSISGEVPLNKFDQALVRKKLNLPSDDPLYDVYPVDRSFLELLPPAVLHEFKFDEFDYFLECEGPPIKKKPA